MGQQIIKFYRETYNLHFSNGILFTTQSIRKSNNFLLNKIYNHIKNENIDKTITVGSLNSYRNIIHPYDVVNSIKYIFNNNLGDDYNICNYNSYKIECLVYKLYKNFNIELIKNEEKNIYYDKVLNIKKIIIEDMNNGLDIKSIDIKGYPTKLINLGWKIKYSIDDIVNEFR